MATVYVKDGNVEQAIRIFRKKVDAEGILVDYRKRMYFKSKGELRREKAKIARSKQLKDMWYQRRLDRQFD